MFGYVIPYIESILGLRLSHKIVAKTLKMMRSSGIKSIEIPATMRSVFLQLLSSIMNKV